MYACAVAMGRLTRPMATPRPPRLPLSFSGCGGRLLPSRPFCRPDPGGFCLRPPPRSRRRSARAAAAARQHTAAAPAH